MIGAPEAWEAIEEASGGPSGAISIGSLIRDLRSYSPNTSRPRVRGSLWGYLVCDDHRIICRRCRFFEESRNLISKPIFRPSLSLAPQMSFQRVLASIW